VKIPARGGNCLVLTKSTRTSPSADVFNARWEKQGRRLLTNIKVVASGCMEGCLASPALLVTPRQTSGTAGPKADVPEMADQHLVGGKPIEMLRNWPRRVLRLAAGTTQPIGL
jgi:(2Fe-2S) ferredoxin